MSSADVDPSIENEDVSIEENEDMSDDDDDSFYDEDEYSYASSDDELPNDVKATSDTVKVAYVVSEPLDLSAPLLELIRSTDLKTKLRLGFCCPNQIHTWWTKDQDFGAAIYDNRIIHSTLRKLKGPDASELYNVKFSLVDFENKVVSPSHVHTNPYGQAILLLVSYVFADRLILIGKKLVFCRVLFGYLKENDELLAEHKVELFRLIKQLQDEMEVFDKQFPDIVPVVGNFHHQCAGLAELQRQLDVFMGNVVNAVLLSNPYN